MNILDPYNEAPPPPPPVGVIRLNSYYLLCHRSVPMITLSCGYPLHDETREILTPYRRKPLDRSKYMPHQGTREMQRRVLAGRK